jgi:hypothetical protein
MLSLILEHFTSFREDLLYNAGSSAAIAAREPFAKFYSVV